MAWNGKLQFGNPDPVFRRRDPQQKPLTSWPLPQQRQSSGWEYDRYDEQAHHLDDDHDHRK